MRGPAGQGHRTYHFASLQAQFLLPVLEASAEINAKLNFAGKLMTTSGIL